MSRLLRFAGRFDFRRLHRSEGGNVMVMYIAAALLLVGMLWAIIGTGQRVVQKETLQSSADAAAFSAAVIKAKGMNIIAFCNLLMALLLAIIILIRLLKTALQIAAVALAVASFFNPGLIPVAAQVAKLAVDFTRIADRLEDGILKAMNGVSKFERGVAKVTPALSLVQAWRVGTDGAYKNNFGDGSLFTVTLPLPVGKDLSLPTKDGTWKQLCDQARATIDRIIEWVVAKLVGDRAAGFLSSAISKVIGPFASAVCGGGGPVALDEEVDQKVTDCNKCMTGSPSDVAWTGVIRGSSGAAGSFTTSAFPASADCSGRGFFWRGVDYQSATFESCIMKEKLTGTMDASLAEKPLPLVLADDWRSRTQVRGFTVLTSTRMSARRQSVGVAVNRGSPAGGDSGAPLPDAIMTMAQAEFFSFNSHNDLWHMDWRARLVPFSFTNGPVGGQTGDTTGEVPSGALDKVRSALGDFANSSFGQTLTRQFLIH